MHLQVEAATSKVKGCTRAMSKRKVCYQCGGEWEVRHAGNALACPICGAANLGSGTSEDRARSNWLTTSARRGNSVRPLQRGIGFLLKTAVVGILIAWMIGWIPNWKYALAWEGATVVLAWACWFALERYRTPPFPGMPRN